MNKTKKWIKLKFNRVLKFRWNRLFVSDVNIFTRKQRNVFLRSSQLQHNRSLVLQRETNQAAVLLLTVYLKFKNPTTYRTYVCTYCTKVYKISKFDIIFNGRGNPLLKLNFYTCVCRNINLHENPFIDNVWDIRKALASDLNCVSAK